MVTAYNIEELLAWLRELRGQRVKVTGIEPERFKHEPGIIMSGSCLNGVFFEGIVEDIDEVNLIVEVRLDSGETISCEYFELEIIE